MPLSVSLRARHNRAVRFQVGNGYTGQGRTARAKLRSSDCHTVLTEYLPGGVCFPSSKRAQVERKCGVEAA